jgi:hypothetical protein
MFRVVDEPVVRDDAPSFVCTPAGAPDTLSDTD